MNGRRLRRVRPEQISKLNKEIQFINDSICNCYRILENTERTVYPGDWMNGRVVDNFHYHTWRTVGVFNLTDHFLVRYLERIKRKRFNENDIKLEYGSYLPKESDMMKIRYANRHGVFTEQLQNEIREFVKNPPEDVRVVRSEDRVITVLTNVDKEI